MLRRVAAFSFAVFIVAWPACAGSDTDTFWNSPSAAALVWRRVLVPPPEQIADTIEIKGEEQSELPAPSDVHGDASLVTVAIEAGKPSVTDANDDASFQMAALEPEKPSVPAPLPPPMSPSMSPSMSLPMSVPFGLATAPIDFGGIVTKWTGVEARIHADNDIIARCRDNEQSCPRAGRIFLDIVAQGRARDGLARIGVINRAVNMAIEPMSDMAQWGVPDRWSPPLETFTTGRGDCEDYAIAKYVALTAAGVPAQDVKLVVVRNTAANEDHAVVAVRNDGDWIILDNRWLTLLKDADMPEAIPLYVLDDGGVREFESPALTAARRMAAPASTGL